MTSATAAIRAATAADAQAIAAIHVGTWRAAYAGLVPQAHLDGLDEGARTERWRQRLVRDCHGTLVAEDARGVLGWIDVGPCRDADAPELGEINAIYVQATAWGAGIGRQLMAAGMHRLARCGHEQVVLWVLAGNSRARNFYARLGFAGDGSSKTIALGGANLVEMRYRSALPTMTPSTTVAAIGERLVDVLRPHAHDLAVQWHPRLLVERWGTAEPGPARLGIQIVEDDFHSVVNARRRRWLAEERAVWTVDAGSRIVEVSSAASACGVTAGAVLDAAPIVPGLTIRIADLFT